MITPFPKASRVQIIRNSKPDHLYAHSTNRVKFYSVVVEEGRSTTYRTSTRTLIKIVQNVKSGNLETLELVKVVGDKEKQRITLPNFTLERLHGFLELLAGLDLDNYHARRAIVVDEQLTDIDPETRASLLSMLSGIKGSTIVRDLMDSGALSDHDIVNTGYRRQQLQMFENMLYNDCLDEYKRDVMGKPTTKDETAWQHFFEQNEWIFGYGLSYRFNTILQREFAASDTDADGSGQVNTDFLTADTRFTAFVELKKPNTPLFGPNRNRSGAWMLSTELFHVHSQALQQKAAGTLKLESRRHLTGKDGEPIAQRALDPKITVVIGCWSEIKNDDYTRRREKQQTFELFRQDTRNLTYITYDELYERAQHIVGQGLVAAPIAA
jgi:hypothetical protein